MSDAVVGGASPTGSPAAAGGSGTGKRKSLFGQRGVKGSCTLCASRKVRCDRAVSQDGQAQDGCSYCRVREVPCSLSGAAKSGGNPAERPAKRQLVDYLPTGGAQRASEAEHQALLALLGGTNPSVDPAATDEPQVDQVLGDLDLQQHLVTLYLNHFNNVSLSLFDGPVLAQRAEAGTVPAYLLLAIAALACRFSHHPAFCIKEARVRGLPFAKRAAHFLALGMAEPSLEKLQAAILLMQYHWGDSAPSQALFFAGATTGYLRALRLTRASRHATPLDIQLEDRALASFFLMDHVSSVGLRQPRFLQESDSAVLADIVGGLPQDNEGTPTGFETWARTLLIYQHLHSLSVTHGSTDGFPVQGDVSSIRVALEEMLDGLPEKLVFTRQNLKAFAARGDGRALTWLHLLLRHTLQIACFPSTPPGEAVEGGEDPLAASFEHACSISSILSQSHLVPSCDVSSSLIGHVLVATSSIFICASLRGPVDRAARAQREAKSIMAVMDSLRQTWLTSAILCEELNAYQSKAAAAHELATWMKQAAPPAKLLLDYGAAAGPTKDRLAPDAGQDGLTTLPPASTTVTDVQPMPPTWDGVDANPLDALTFDWSTSDLSLALAMDWSVPLFSGFPGTGRGL